MIADRRAEEAAAEPLWRARARLAVGALRRGWALFVEARIGLVGLAIIGFYGALAIVHPILLAWVWDPRTYDPVIGYAFEEVAQPAPPSAHHLLGTDPLGRDVLSQLMFGARAAFVLGAIAAVVTVVVGTAVGAVAAYFGRWVDAFLMRLADLVVMMPTVSLLLLLGGLYDLTLHGLGIVIGLLSGLGGAAILLKAQALSIVAKPYMDAARVAGGGHRHLLVAHVVPALLPLATLSMMFTVTAAVFAEAVLSFFGVMDVRMSWGLMIHAAQSAGYLLGGAGSWWLVVPAGLSITLFCGSFYLLGRALDQVVNPRLRRS